MPASCGSAGCSQPTDRFGLENAAALPLRWRWDEEVKSFSCFVAPESAFSTWQVGDKGITFSSTSFNLAIRNNTLCNMDEVEIAANEQDDSQNNKNPLQFQKSTISCVQECEASNAERLCIFDISRKLDYGNEYDIGGAFIKKNPELWFYMTTEICPSNIIILNLFVCHRNIGYINLGISNSNERATDSKQEDYVFLSESLSWKSFKSSKKDQCHYIKSFIFHTNDVESLVKKTLIIPIKIDVTPNFNLNLELVKRVQAKHAIGGIIRKETPDFTLESATHKKFPTHKVVLCTQSPVLKDLIKNSTADSMFFDTTDDVLELLTEYLYSGTIKDITKYDNEVLLELGEKFKLDNLMPFIENAIIEKITIDNVIETAQLAQKHRLQSVERKVYKYFKDNPDILQTDAWKNLVDVVLTKKLLEHLYFDK
ncbi:unnamed protein product [Leptosia nina]|uniref:BTB domain-containing protein n=1 Tax=Leptosia nina TaxID=320188 RepID=A0AAV1JHD0_9NEOP